MKFPSLYWFPILRVLIGDLAFVQRGQRLAYVYQFSRDNFPRILCVVERAEQ